MNKKTYLRDNWKVSIIKHPGNQVSIPGKLINKWIPAFVPGTIHTDLLKAGLITNPFEEKNENELEWISSSNCIYRTHFIYPYIFDKKSSLKLVFEGIDTIADVYLNNRLLGRTDNMFLRYEFNISHLLKHGKNSLELRFESPLEAGKKNIRKYGKTVSSDSSRYYIRKAQYSFGWDWGPSYPTMGVWRPVYLLYESQAVISRLKFDTERLTKYKAYVKVSFTVLHNKGHVTAVLLLSRGNRKLRREINIGNQSDKEIRLIIENPDLWWPNGHGKQNLYDLEIQIINGSGKILGVRSTRVGIRKIQLQLKEKNKATFRFKINGKTIFIKGMNWIPADSFLPRVDQKKYRRLLTLAKNANANMVRVWGGGIYESDEFYDLCDELGLLVWQDFMFACGFYPENINFINSVSDEIKQNVERLMIHPCIALWCGNNENEWIWYREKQRPISEMSGYKIFHKLIPDLINASGSSLPYRPTSPFGEEKDPNSQNSGNRHQWDIWSNWMDYNQVQNDRSLFVTEFGFQAPANPDTFNGIIPAVKRRIQSSAFEYYNKQIEGPERVVRFIAAHLPLRTEWEDFIYLAQLNQALALKTCIEHWRSNKKTNGSIIWQLNDCWPVTSWSLIDSGIIPKISYYFIRNIFSETIIYFSKSDSNLKINLLTEREETDITFALTIIDAKSGKYLLNDKKKISLSHQKHIEMSNINISDLPEDKNWIIIATLYDHSKNIIHRNFYLEKEWKHLILSKALVKSDLTVISGTNFLILSADKPVFFIDVYCKGMTFSDRGFILLPREKKKIEITAGKNKSINKKNVKIFSLNNYLGI